MKRQAVEFVVDASDSALVMHAVRGVAGDALERLTIAPVDGTPRCKITALLARELAAAAMQAVMNALDKSR